ncbi:hypothetical protein [Streptomyces sp. NPDC047974]|uniref:hypothetical protein n=1 Tax=Streptomyces sp. NPDC047974 TaxID=3154343 RepID=UPI0033E2EA08
MSRSRVRRTRPTRLRLTAALAVTLAATTAATVAGPGTAAASPATTPAAASLPVLGTQDRVVSVGATGFLTSNHHLGASSRWTPYDGGTPVDLPTDDGTRYSGADEADVVVGKKGTSYTVRDMANGGDPVVIDSPYALHRVNGSTLVMKDDATSSLHLVSREPGGRTVDRTVTGFPAGYRFLSATTTAPGTVVALLRTPEPGSSLLALVDVATAKVTETYAAPGMDYRYPAQLTPKRIAWITDDTTHVVDRATKTSQVLPHRSQLAFGGDWLAVEDATRLTFRSLKDGRTAEPLRFANQMTPGADGTLLVRGGTAADGWGVFRVALGADGAPTVTLVADIPDGDELALKSLSVPSRITSFTGGSARFGWEFDEEGQAVVFELTHTATGRTVRLDGGPYEPWLNWRGELANRFGAYNGAYTWKMTAAPTGFPYFGPGVHRTGTLTVAVPPQPRDFNDNSGSDALVRDSAGNLSAYGIGQLVSMKGVECSDSICTPRVTEPDPERLGTGWNTYTLMASPGNLAGGAADDIVGRDRDGVLWLHQSEKQKLLPRTKVGGGWQVYNKITGGSDLNNDGRGDLLATDTAGVLWFYASTGDAKAPFKPRVKIGGGWQIYNLLTAPGNIAGATGGDLLARDKDGVLWLYLGKGDGTFTARRKVGGGWQKYTHVIPAGINGKGVADLYAVGASGSAHYSGRDSTTTPFEAATVLPLRADSTTYKTFF